MLVYVYVCVCLQYGVCFFYDGMLVLGYFYVVNNREIFVKIDWYGGLGKLVQRRDGVWILEFFEYNILQCYCDLIGDVFYWCEQAVFYQVVQFFVNEEDIVQVNYW